MNNKDYLNEEEYQKNAKKINSVANILLIVGGIMLICGFVMVFAYHKIAMGIFAVIGLALLGFGGQAKLIGNGRKINAFMMQQQMPIVKEGAEELAPTAGKVGKEVAKGITEGIKEGMESEEENK